VLLLCLAPQRTEGIQLLLCPDLRKPLAVPPMQALPVVTATAQQLKL
jgi:hypothetical protein